ncbi:putative prophage PSSB64-02, Orf63 [Pseudomonas coronafaciens pv. porri]|uniref:hypothetical protein n=1 Tax=Pseudomonas syringae group TaxID=136849 RepID=UPI0006ABC2FD|nr:hypothetical protein [Pseudomonas coronafaciens]KPY25473.1 putative prophage PSSB64-02, Orf63 [Pseudomonas coronafaciens pv. porri]RMU83092.1 putative prophage PSSB64-02, Orf63 [Pseudomonas coronafaciens pv. porri]RMV98231.1 putative prophage PSSB64-02, Orf63 [Pseudomonas coronafaciens pv. porri]RMW01904.1 putative prophage PSSB64-02, Orf63 [Pseudomonas coronafaciens pv. porri]
MKNTVIPPRILRANQVHGYLGMCRDEFNKTVRPNVREFPIGKQGVGFDRLELDAWADAYIATNSVDKRQRSDTPLLPKPEKRLVGRAGSQAPAAKPDPHAKSKEEFERVVAMVTGKSGKHRAPHHTKQPE